MAQLEEIPNPKSQIPNNSQILNSKRIREQSSKPESTGFQPGVVTQLSGFEICDLEVNLSLEFRI